MDKKKAALVVLGLIVIVLITGTIIAAIKNKALDKDKDEVKMPTTFTISYSYGGGYTTYASSLTRKITVDQDGKVVIELDVDDPLVAPMEYKIDKDKANELMKYFYKNKFYDLKKDLSVDDVTDMYSSYLEVKSNTFNRKVGGYAASLNDKFKKFETKFDSIISEDMMKEFNKRVTEAYEKSDY